MRKLAFSRTLETAPWENTELVRDDAAKTIAALKAEDGKDMLVFGGPTFASSLVRADLIDEFNFFINPVVLGRGVSMFKDLDDWRFMSPVAGPCLRLRRGRLDLSQRPIASACQLTRTPTHCAAAAGG